MADPTWTSKGFNNTLIDSDYQITAVDIGHWCRITCSTTDVGVTFLDCTQYRSAGSTLFMKMDDTPYRALIAPFAGQTINGVSSSIVLKNQFDFVLVLNGAQNETNLRTYCGNIGSITTSDVTIYSADFIATSNKIHLVDTNSSVTVTLPSQGQDNILDGKFIFVVDQAGNASNNPITIQDSDSTIYSAISSNNGSAFLMYSDVLGKWFVINSSTGGTGASGQWRGTWAGSSSLFPVDGGSGPSGLIQAGDYWDVPVTYTFPDIPPNTTIYAPNSIRALTDNPGQNINNWFIAENSLLREAGDYDTFPDKNNPVGADTLLIEDSDAAQAKKEITLDSLPVSIATQTAINNAVTSGQQWQGTWQGSGSLYPITRAGGAPIQAGDVFTVDVTYTYPAVSGTTIYQTTTLRAKVNSPGQIPSNWANEGNAVDKQIKVSTAVLDNIASWDNAGNTKDSGIAINSIPTVTTNQKAIYLASNGNDTTGNGTILKPYATWSKAESSVTGSSFVYMTDTATYTGNVISAFDNVLYICQGNLQNSKSVYTGTFNIANSNTRRAFQGIQFNPGTNQAINHTSSAGLLNLQNCSFIGTNTNIITAGANIVSGGVGYVNLCDFGGATGNLNLANNTSNIAFTGNLTTGSNIITNTSVDTAGLPVGYTLTATGLPGGCIFLARLSATSCLINYNATATSSGTTIYHPVSWYMNNNTGLKLNIGLGHVVFGYNNGGVTVSGQTVNYVSLDNLNVTKVVNTTAMIAQTYATFGGIGNFTVVTNDPINANNGLWQLTALPISTLSNWQQISQANPSLNTTLTGALTNIATSMTVNSTNGFASTGTIYINAEAITYTGKTSTTFTGLTRGQNGTTAAAHSIGSLITTIGSGGSSSTIPVLNTALTSNMTNSDVTMSVTSTNGFSPTGILYIDNEAIAYTGITSTSFTGLTRGLYNTTAVSHITGAIVTSLGLPYNSGNPTGGNIIGAIMPFGGTTAPTGAFICDGSAISRTTYSALFAVIGTAHGSGDGSTTFNIPDLRGRVVRGVDGSAGRDPDSASRTAMNTGGNTGNQIGSVQLDAFASHTHTYNQGSALSTQAQGGTGSASNYAYTNTSTNTGSSGTSTETRMKNAYENWIIWYNNFGNYGDVYLANNNAMAGNNTFAGTSTFNNNMISNLSTASGTFTPVVVDSSNVFRKQPPSASLAGTALSFLSTPPASPGVDDTYVVQPTGTGVWAGHDNQIATWNGSAWGYYTPVTNDLVGLSNGDIYQFNGTAWVTYTQAGGSFLKQTITSSLTLTSWQREIRVNCTTASIVVTIPQTLSTNISQEVIVTRIDNNTNYTVSINAYSGQTINGVNTIYLYNQWDSIKISSNGAANSSDIITDARNTGGSGTRSFLVNEIVGQTGLVTGTVFSYPVTPLFINGTSATMSSAGNILIKANSGTWNLTSNVNRTGSTASDEFSWGFYNFTTGLYFGQCGSMESANNTSPTVGYGGIAFGTIAPTVDTVIQVRCTKATGTHTLDANGQANQVASSLRVEQISTPVNTVNVADTLSVMGNSAQTTIVAGQALSFPTVLYGNIPWTGTQATLTAGKTYLLQFIPSGISNSSISVESYFYNWTTSTSFGSRAILNAIAGNYTMPVQVIYTPTVTSQISFVTAVAATPGTIGDPARNTFPQLNITQIGSSAVSTPTNTIPQLAKNVTGTSCRGVVFIHRNQLWQMGVYGGSGSSTNATANCTIPTIVPINNTGAAISGWLDVAYSYDSAIALTTDGRVFYWGYNSLTTAFQPIATLVPGLTSVTVTKIYCCTNKGGATNNSFYCITNAGTVYSFGDNAWGQLGIGNNTATSTATLIGSALSGKIVTKLSVSGNGSTHVAAIDSTGQLYTWGYGAQGTAPTCNPLGTGVANTNSNVPVAISGFTNVIDVIAACEYTPPSGANNFTRILRADGSSWGSGNNSTGQLATGNTTSTSSFVRESLNKTNISAIYAYETYNGGCSIIIDTAGILYFSGNNNDQCFGDGSTNNSAHTSFTNTTQLNNAGFQGKMLIGSAGIQPKVLMMGTCTGGYNTAVVLDNTGTVWAAGRYQEGQTANPNSSSTNAFLSAIAGTKGVPVVDIKAIGLNGVDGGLLMLFQDGTMMTAGINTSGALGNETTVSNAAVAYGRHVIGYSVATN